MKDRKATEMDFWRRSAGITRRDHVRNERVHEIMDAKQTIVHEIMTKQLVWYGHVQRMADDRLPKKVLDWVPPGRKRRGHFHSTPGRSATPNRHPCLSNQNLSSKLHLLISSWMPSIQDLAGHSLRFLPGGTQSRTFLGNLSLAIL